jgi:hypothetical protein
MVPPKWRANITGLKGGRRVVITGLPNRIVALGGRFAPTRSH